MIFKTNKNGITIGGKTVDEISEDFDKLSNYISEKASKISSNLSAVQDKINSKIQTCKRIITKAEKGEKEAILIKNRVAENQLNNELEGSKNKDKKRIR